MEKITSISANYLTDIRFWIILFFAIRLYGITNPPLEVAHNWRQSTVTMVARNFYETDSNILYPRVDFAGDKTGITGMEFPFLNYLVYLFSLVFGYGHWYGRLINLVVSSIGVFYFFKIVRKYFGKDVAFYSSLVLLSSIWFAYSRKIMPDTFSMSLVLTGLYYGTAFLDTGSRKTRNLFLYVLFMLSGILFKLPSAYLLVLFLPFFSNKKIDRNSKLLFLVTNILLFVPIGLWYLYWVPHLVEKYGFWHFFMGKSIAQGVVEISQNISITFEKFYFDALKFVGFGVFLFGLWMGFYKKNRMLLAIFLLCSFSFLIIMLKAGFTFSQHSYYIIPFVPVMALFCGYGISQMIHRRIIFIVLAAIIIEGILDQKQDFFLKDREIAIASLESDLDKFTNRDDLIFINSGNNPTAMYFAHRKGWIASNQQVSDTGFINSIKIKGCKYVIILKQCFGTGIDLNYHLIFSNVHYTIYKL